MEKTNAEILIAAIKRFFSAEPGSIWKDPRIGLRFCKVEMNGCMATVRGAERWGHVIDVGESSSGSYAQPKPVLNISHRNRKNSYLLVRYDDGSESWEPLWWCNNSELGHLEYQV